MFAFPASARASFVADALYFTDGGVSISRGTPGDDVPDHLHQQPKRELDLRHRHDGMENKQTKRAEA